MQTENRDATPRLAWGRHTMAFSPDAWPIPGAYSRLEKFRFAGVGYYDVRGPVVVIVDLPVTSLLRAQAYEELQWY